ncbi:MAG: glycosyltransferase [Planctomycetota bacterium]
MPKLSLAIPTWNGGALLGEVLAAIDRQPGAAALERVAIDSGSRDDTVARLQQHGFTVETIEQKDFDHGLTRDALVARCSGDIVILLTQDAIPADEAWLPALIASYDDPGVGAAYCKQLPRPDCNPFIARRLREWTAGKDQPVTQAACSRPEFDALEPMQRLQRCAYDNVAGSVRRSAHAAVGGFGRRPFGEDVAFGRKLILSGWNIVFQARSAVVHSHNRPAREEGRRIYCDHQNLRDLFGLHLLPTWDSYRAAVAWGEKEYARIVDELALEPAEASALHEWARAYAHQAALGMYLGAGWPENSTGRDRALFVDIDRRMHAGI